MDNIEKLREKVEKDPASTLFVPLAEEYRKIGQLDEAILILKSGIDRQPGYMSARVSLGKIYIEKDMKTEAMLEFERVVEAIPDNLFAQRKLAEIYNDLDKREMAISRYETVLSLNPLDEEAQEILEGLKASSPVNPMKDQIEEEIEGPDMDAQEALAPGETLPKPEDDEDIIIGMDKPPDWSSALDGETSVGEAPEEAAAEALDEEQVGNVESVLEALSEPEGAEEISEGEVEKTEGVKDAMSGVEPAVHAMELAGLEEADQSIGNGDYARAIEIYNTNLKINPDDAQVLQRVNELRALLKLLGRENELMESELNSFLDAVKARRDEFFGSS